jgi:hypothetical protein
MPRRLPAPTSRTTTLVATLCGLAVGVTASALLLYRNGGQMVKPLMVSARECVIKGDINPENGQKIFYLPDQKSYASAVIQTDKGERWFCAEADALAAGWRKASD